MSKVFNKKSVLAVREFLHKFATEIEIIELKSSARTAKDASISLNTEVGAIVKSIVLKDRNNEFYLCLCSGDKYISIEKASNLVDIPIEKASASEVKAQTGFSIGGVSPVGHLNRPKTVLIDHNLAKFSKIYAAAGHPTLVFEATYNNLLELTQGIPTDIVEKS